MMNKNEWKKVKLGDIFDLQMGKTPSRNNRNYWENGTNNWISISDIKENEKYIEKTKEKITDIAIQESKIKCIPKNTVIMSFKLSVGKVAITSKDIYTNEAVVAFLPKNLNIIDNNYLYYFLPKINWSKGINKAVKGLTLNKPLISNKVISFPDLQTQKQIAEKLDLLSYILNLKKKQLFELEKLAKFQFLKMFGDPILNEKNWKVEKLKENILEMFLGPFGSSLKVESYVPKDKSFCMVYEQKHAIKKSINLENHYINNVKYNELKRFEVKPLDFIMSCRGTIGEIFQLPENAHIGIIHPSLMKIRINNLKYNYTFFEKILSFYIKKEITTGSGVKMAITAKELGKKEFIIPPIELQNKFAEFVKQVDKSKVSSLNFSILGEVA